MIEEIAAAHLAGDLGQSELFLGLVRCSEESGWHAVFESLKCGDQTAFQEWAIPLVTREHVLFGAGMEPLSETELGALKSRCKERGWV